MVYGLMRIMEKRKDKYLMLSVEDYLGGKQYLLFAGSSECFICDLNSAGSGKVTWKEYLLI